MINITKLLLLTILLYRLSFYRFIIIIYIKFLIILKYIIIVI